MQMSKPIQTQTPIPQSKIKSKSSLAVISFESFLEVELKLNVSMALKNNKGQSKQNVY